MTTVSPHETDLASRERAVPDWVGSAAAAGLYGLALLVLTFRTQIDQITVIPYVPEYLSEYSAHELFTRLMCVGVVIGALVAARSATSRGTRLASAVFMTLGVVLYAGETNLLANKMQPIMAMGIAPVLLFLLWRHARRALWPVLFAGVLGVLALAADYFHDQSLAAGAFADPAGWRGVLGHREEELDMLSLTAFAHAAWCIQRGAMPSWIRNAGYTNAALIFLGVLAVVVGQSLAHWSYHIPLKQTVLAVTLAWGGTLIALTVNERHLLPGVRLGTRDRGLFVAVCFIAGAVVPVFYRARDGRLDALYWPLIAVAIVLYLSRARWEEEDTGVPGC